MVASIQSSLCTLNTHSPIDPSPCQVWSFDHARLFICIKFCTSSLLTFGNPSSTLTKAFAILTNWSLLTQRWLWLVLSFSHFCKAPWIFFCSHPESLHGARVLCSFVLKTQLDMAHISIIIQITPNLRFFCLFV